MYKNALFSISGIADVVVLIKLAFSLKRNEK
jgi:hypothetical protein